MKTSKSAPSDTRFWLEIELGNFKTVDEYMAALSERGFAVSEWARAALSDTPISPSKRTVRLARVSLSVLGFSDQATFEAIRSVLAEHGLKLCDAEVGPALRLVDTGLPNRDVLIVGNVPVHDPDGLPSLFVVTRSHLKAESGADGRIWPLETTFVFECA